MTRYSLTPQDYSYAARLGTARCIEAILARRREINPHADPLIRHINGAMAEVAVARYLGQPLPQSVNTFHHEPDIPPDIEVRWRSNPDWDLYIADNDNLTRRFVLVTGWAPTLEIRGWITGTEGAQPAHRRDYGHGESWFIPQHQLRDIAGLVA